MGRFVYWMNVSLDLRIEAAPGEEGGGSWLRIGESLHREFNARARALSLMVEGRTIYETMEAYWPDAPNDAALPDYLPRYFMGLGTTAELLRMVAIGIDMFDCVVPTRLARHGVAMTAGGNLSLRQARYREDLAPIEEGCECPGCQIRFSRAYLRHLHVARELLADRILSVHNVTHLIHVMQLARNAIIEGELDRFIGKALAGITAGIDTKEAHSSPLSW